MIFTVQGKSLSLAGLMNAKAKALLVVCHRVNLSHCGPLIVAYKMPGGVSRQLRAMDITPAVMCFRSP